MAVIKLKQTNLRFAFTINLINSPPDSIQYEGKRFKARTSAL